MPLKPLSEPGVPFSIPVVVNHNLTSLFVLPEGSFYTVESLVLNAATGVPLRPVIDYMYYQQNIPVSLTTGKQTASIIHLRNQTISSIVVKGSYSHGVEQSEIDNWNNICTTYADIPNWMNWLAALDDPLHLHPDIKRMSNLPNSEDRSLSIVALELNYIADQYMNGDTLFISHIEYWQRELFTLVKVQYDANILSLNAFISTLKTDVQGKVGDYRFTDGDGKVWSNNKSNQWLGTTLRDRGVQAVGTYTYLPEGSAIPSRLTNLFSVTSTIRDVEGLIVTNKQSYNQHDIMSINLTFSKITNRISTTCTLQVVDVASNTVVTEFTGITPIIGTLSYTFNLADYDIGGGSRKLLVRVVQFMMLVPSIVTVTSSTGTTNGYISAELIGYDNVGSISSTGYVNTIKVKFKRVGTLRSAKTLYVHLSGDYPDALMKPGYPKLQTFNFPMNFNESEVIVAQFVIFGTIPQHYRIGVDVSTEANPLNELAKIATNVWYISAVPINPYIEWYFANKVGNLYERVGTVEEGTDVYAIGNCSVDVALMGIIPQLTVISNGVGSAVEGVDFIIDRSNLITVDKATVAYKISLPFKPEQEAPFKYLFVKSINSNTASLWISDKTGNLPFSATWRETSAVASNVVDWMSETSTVFLHISAPSAPDGTVLNISLSSPELHRAFITFPSTATVFGRQAVIAVTIAAPNAPNANQYLKLLITGPSINYTTLGLLIVDTAKPYYEIRYIVNGITDALTANPGDTVRCQVRCLKAATASASATLMMSGTSVPSDFVLPNGATSLLLSNTVNSVAWKDIFVTGLAVQNQMRLDLLTTVVNVVFPTNASGLKMGLDTNAILNLRRV